MAQKRMFSNDVISNDNFIEMPDSSQNLYFHLSMNADDDGFVANYKSVMRMLGKKEDDLKVLLGKQFILPFENGLLVIRHWRLNNYIQKDRYKETIYKEEKAQLTIDNNNVYNLDTNCIHSIDKISIEENRVVENSIEEKFKKPTLNELNDFCKTNNLKIDCERFINYYESKGWLVGKAKMKDWKATARNWGKTNDKETPTWLDQNIKAIQMTAEEEEELKKGME